MPAVVLALAVGMRLVGPVADASLSYGSRTARFTHAYDTLAAYGVLAVGAVLVTVGVGLLFLRSSTAVEELRTG